MRVSGFYSNHVVYLKWHATLKKLMLAHTFRVRKFSSLSDSDQYRYLSLFIRNASSRIIKCEPHRSFFAQQRCLLSRNVLSIREGIQCARITWISGEICRSRYSQYIFFRTKERLWEITRRRTKCKLPSARILSNAFNYRITCTARFEQILIRFNNKFWIVTTKRVVITRLGERAFHTRWHQRQKYKIGIIKKWFLSIFIVIPKKRTRRSVMNIAS